MPENAEHNPNVDLWDCPCKECWKLERDLHDNVHGDSDPFPTYAQWKAERS